MIRTLVTRARRCSRSPPLGAGRVAAAGHRHAGRAGLDAGQPEPRLLRHRPRLDRRAQGRAADPVRRHRRRVQLGLLPDALQRRLAGRASRSMRPEGVPPLTMDTQPGDPNVLQRLIVTRKGESLQMGYGQVPVSAYSDGKNLVGDHRPRRDDPLQARRELARRRVPRTALRSSRRSSNWLSADGLRCSKTVGECVPAPNNIPTACELATGAGCTALLGETCQPTPDGVCVDPTSSQNNGTPASERFTTGERDGVRHRGPEPAAVTTSRSRPCAPTSSSTPPSRTVKRFTFLPFANDYRPGSGALLVWGRPLWDGEQGRQSQVYLMVHQLPIQKARERPLDLPAVVLRGRAPAHERPDLVAAAGEGEAARARRRRRRQPVRGAAAREPALDQLGRRIDQASG